MVKRMIIMLLIAALVFGGIFGYKAIGNHFMNQFFDNMPMPPVHITAATVSTDQWQPYVSAIGSFVAINGTELSTEVSGIVKGIHFDNGAAISKGQVLLTLDDTVDQAELPGLMAVEKLAKIELSRYQRLFKEKSVSELDLIRRESEAEQATAAVLMQQARIAQKTIVAPFSGIAGIRQVNLGQLVSPGTNVVSLQSLDPIYLNFSLPEQFLSNINTEQQLTVMVDAYPQQPFSGKVTAIAPAVKTSTRSIEIQATFANPQQKLRPGMFARVQMDNGDITPVTLVPQTAVQFNPYGNSVFVLRETDGQLSAHQRFVVTGKTRGDLIAIEKGLEPGEQVATSGLLKLRNGAAVVISSNGRAQPSAEQHPAPANQ